MINALTTNYQSLQLTPKLEYKRKRWEGKLEAPLQYYHYSFAHAATNKHVYLFSPSAYFRWHTTPKLYLFLRAGLSTDPCDLHSLYNGLVMTDYRTLSRGLNEYAAVKSRFLSGGSITRTRSRDCLPTLWSCVHGMTPTNNTEEISRINILSVITPTTPPLQIIGR